MKRGEIWTVASGSGYGGKPRPSVVVQADDFLEIDSVVVCGLTTNETDAPLFRLPVLPSASNGLLRPSRIMVDKVLAVPKTRIGHRIGRLEAGDLLRLNQALIVFLGMATSPRARPRPAPAAEGSKRA